MTNGIRSWMVTTVGMPWVMTGDPKYGTCMQSALVRRAARGKVSCSQMTFRRSFGSRRAAIAAGNGATVGCERNAGGCGRVV